VFEVSRRRRGLDIWPGYVDAISSLLLVVVFVVLVFTLGHFVLSNALRGREQVLERLNAQVSELSRLLSLEEVKSESLGARVGELTATLRKAQGERDTLAGELGATRGELAAAQATAARLGGEVEALAAARGDRERQSADLGRALEESRRAAEAEVEQLTRQIAALREQLDEVASALELAEQKTKDQAVEIADLGNRLNVALASKVQELARYRSEFFGRLREVLGDRPDIRVVGDRFVFQSELLFETASSELGPAGREQVRRLVATLNEVAAKIPSDIEWILQIDGHTDRRPIHTAEFPSNWELSAARALAIVKYAIELGVPPRRLAANGFAEFHPLDTGTGEQALARNRRIEFKLTSR
jgi:chemotaxis protein MotB